MFTLLLEFLLLTCVFLATWNVIAELIMDSSC